MFFAIQWLISNKKYFVSDHFLTNQIHLLTHDSFKRFEDFFTIAQDTNVIEIKDNNIHISDASHLKGRETGDVHSLLKSRGSTAVIGPAAENGVLFSSTIIDGHFAAGRSGIGLTFATKNLKYITIRGTGKTKVFDPEGLRSAREDVFRLTAASPILLGKFGISRFGTGALYDLMDARRMMPTENFRKTRFDQAFKLNAHAFKKKFKPKNTGCRQPVF